MGIIIILYTFGAIFLGLIVGSIIVAIYTKKEDEDATEKVTLKYTIINVIIARVIVVMTSLVIFNVFFSFLLENLSKEVMDGNLPIISLFSLFLLGCIMVVFYKVVYYFIKRIFLNNK